VFLPSPLQGPRLSSDAGPRSPPPASTSAAWPVVIPTERFVVTCASPALGSGASGLPASYQLPASAGGLPASYQLPASAGGLPASYQLPASGGGLPASYQLPASAGGCTNCNLTSPSGGSAPANTPESVLSSQAWLASEIQRENERENDDVAT